ncbi:hypothetical protein [Candidatus Palauibacter sp.]|uniref:hypothetical protein n=1 Tax=Candidatus Palauibacter sp. TaxID=3101350 RepID=UPI003B5236C1
MKKTRDGSVFSVVARPMLARTSHDVIGDSRSRVTVPRRPLVVFLTLRMPSVTVAVAYSVSQAVGSNALKSSRNPSGRAAVTVTVKSCVASRPRESLAVTVTFAVPVATPVSASRRFGTEAVTMPESVLAAA